MKVTMEKLGINASYSRPRASNDTPFCEALFRTCKYCPNWQTKGFATRADARAGMKSFTSWYHGVHLYSAIGFVTPNERQEGQGSATLANRGGLSAVTCAQKPERGSGKSATGAPPDPSGSTQNKKSATLISETPHEIDGQRL